MRHTDRIDIPGGSGVPARISTATHREIRYVAALLTMQERRTVTLGHLITLAWEALKQQRPDIQALLQHVDQDQ